MSKNSGFSSRKGIPFLPSDLFESNQIKPSYIPATTPGVQSIVSAASVTPVFGNDLVVITAQQEDLILKDPTGGWIEGKELIIRIKDDGNAQVISYDPKYRAIGVTLPTTTSPDMTIYLGVMYNETDDKFDIIGVSIEA